LQFSYILSSKVLALQKIGLNAEKQTLWYSVAKPILREFRILFEVRFTFLQKRILAFLCFISQVIEQRFVTCQFLNTCLTIQFGFNPALIMRKATD
jgi:hypothetical protein